MAAGFQIRATICLVGAILCWSMVPLFLKYLTGYMDGWTANGLRYPLGVLVWLPWLVRLGRHPQAGRLAVRALLPASVNLTGQCFWAWAPYYIDPGLMALLVRASVLWATVASLVVFADERRLLGSGRFWVGLAAGAGGFVGLSVLGGALRGGATLTGVLIILACSLFWGSYGVTVRWSMRRVDPRLAFCLIGLYTAIGTGGLMAAVGEPLAVARLPARAVAAVAVSAVVGISLPHVLYYAAIARIGVAIASGTSLVSPFLTASASRVIYGERLLAGQWFCGAVLICGAAMLVWAQQHLGRPELADRPGRAVLPSAGQLPTRTGGPSPGRSA